MFRRGKLILALLATVAALLVGNTGTAFAGTGPTSWQFGNTADTCTGAYYASIKGCVYHEGSSTFQLGYTNETLQFKPSGGGNLIGWYDSGSYWFSSHTTSGTSAYDLALQGDCNVVIYQQGYVGNSAGAVWAVGSQSSDPNRDNCRIVMHANYFMVQMHSSTAGWWDQCSVPNGYIGVTCNEGPR